MKVVGKDLFLYAVFVLLFFWDLLDEIMPNVQFVILILIFFIYVIKYRNIKIYKQLFFVAIIVFIHGIINIAIGNDQFNLLIVQLLAICVSYVTFDTLLNQHSVKKIFRVYWNFAYIMALVAVTEEVIGILNIKVLTQIPLLYTFTNFDYRVVGFVKLAGLCREPSFLGYFLAPAMCIILFNVLAPELANLNTNLVKERKKMFFIFIAYVFTFSGVAYFGVAVMIVLIWFMKGISFKKILIPIVTIIVAVNAYYYIPDIKVRIDDTISIFNDNKSNEVVNLSSFTYYSNYRVVGKVVKNTYGLGSGLGSYQLMYDKYSIGGWGESGMMLNREDANSGFLRILSELGVLGIISVGIFFIYFRVGGGKKLCVNSISLLSLFIMYLLRQGNYTHGGSVLFICLYVKIWRESKVTERYM